MTACTVCVPRGDDQPHESEIGWLCCWRARSRMESALRAIPEHCDTLAGGGFVERDVRDGTRAVWDGERIVRVPSVADPVANLMPAGPLNGASNAPRVGGSSVPSVPIRIDPTDLLAPARPGSLAVADTGRYASDQVGHLAVATELEFWARDWADTRRERCPLPTVHVLAGWLADRLDWAIASHPALDEFAAKVSQLHGSLVGALGLFDAKPKEMEAPCPDCDMVALTQAYPDALVECEHCPRVLFPHEYADWCRTLGQPIHLPGSGESKRPYLQS